MPLAEGILAPEFELPDENGRIHKLSDYLGKSVLLYFYPKDDTPGCTMEACNFRNDYSIYEQAGIVILGISPDDSASHARFANKYNLPFALLADSNHKICQLYEVWGPKNFMGKEYEGVQRTTYLLDAKGTIIKVFPNVKPDGHSQEVLAVIKR